MRQPLYAAIRQQIYDALVENVTVVIRDQDLTARPEQFGELMEDQNRMYLAEGEPLVSVLSIA